MQLSFVLSASWISMLLEDWNSNVTCYTSQPKYVFRLEENVSRAVGQNSLTPLGRTKLCNSLGRTKLTNSLGKQQLELSTHAWSGCAPCNSAKFMCQPTSGKQFLLLLLFFSYFELGGIQDTSWLAPRETVSSVSPRPQCSPRLRLREHWGSWGYKTHCFPRGQSLNA